MKVMYIINLMFGCLLLGTTLSALKYNGYTNLLGFDLILSVVIIISYSVTIYGRMK